MTSTTVEHPDPLQHPLPGATIWLLLLLGVSWGAPALGAPESPERTANPAVPSPWSGSVALGGNLSRGNLDQVNLQVRGQLGYRDDRWSNDVFLRAFRTYLRPAEAPSFVRIGDDLVVQNVVARALTHATQLSSIGRYETSQLHQLDHRALLGLGFGLLPLREPDRQVRFLVAGMLEHARYPEGDFRIDLRNDGRFRTVPRIALLGDGLYRPEQSSLSLRYSALFVVNPAEPIDHRIVVDGAVAVVAWGPLGIELGGTYTYSSVTLVGVDPQDLQVSVGLSASTRSKR